MLNTTKQNTTKETETSPIHPPTYVTYVKLPTALKRALEKIAAREHRSLSSQIIHMIETSIKTESSQAIL